jgi:hypothetical protein
LLFVTLSAIFRVLDSMVVAMMSLMFALAKDIKVSN